MRYTCIPVEQICSSCENIWKTVYSFKFTYMYTQLLYPLLYKIRLTTLVKQPNHDDLQIKCVQICPIITVHSFKICNWIFVRNILMHKTKKHSERNWTVIDKSLDWLPNEILRKLFWWYPRNYTYRVGFTMILCGLLPLIFKYILQGYFTGTRVIRLPLVSSTSEKTAERTKLCKGHNI